MMKMTKISWLTILLVAMPIDQVDSAGIQSIGTGSGGYFSNSNFSGIAYVGHVDHGVMGKGNETGGIFFDLDSSGYARVGYSDFGIKGYGNEAGGYFKDRNSSGYAYVGYGDWGIRGYGNTAGARFDDLNSSGYGLVGYADWGFWGMGKSGGGRFNDSDSSSIASVGYGTYKIQGTGMVSFIQNHPTEPSQVIVYAAPEGDEVATYTRGSAVLVNGEARISLGETFKWVTNPDIGLTAHLTPQGEGSVLYVASKTTEELVVRSMEGFPDDVTFDYIVHGLRIGFEEVSIVQEKTEEAYIPSMEDHRARYDKHPELRQYNALERYGDIRTGMGMKAVPDMKATGALIDAITEFNPAIHELPLLEHELPLEPESPVKLDPESPPDS